MVLQVLKIILFQVCYLIMVADKWVKLVSLINLNFKKLVMEYLTLSITAQKVIKEVILVAIILLESMLISPNPVQKLGEQLDLSMRKRKKSNRTT
jgi:hypothetical protein